MNFENELEKSNKSESVSFSFSFYQNKGIYKFEESSDSEDDQKENVDDMIMVNPKKNTISNLIKNNKIEKKNISKEQKNEKKIDIQLKRKKFQKKRAKAVKNRLWKK